ncbi:transketolase C-terminal domain-containing protein [candidate division KSB1 bacterium]
MGKVLALSGNEASAEAMRQINPDVVAAFPITPQTELMHKFTEFVANGEVETEMVLVESEHSAMTVSVGASAAGARAMTATSANGLALMWEIVYIAASLRLPIVMPTINRALSGPINIHCDHSDTMGARDSGWLQIFSENCQEAYDNTIIAVKIAENKDVLLPVMITLDGFIISHTLERVDILDDKAVTKFVGEYIPRKPLLDVDNPVTVGPLDLQDYYFEHKRQQIEAINNSYKVIENADEEYGKLSGRKYSFVEEYFTDDAEIIIVALGSTAGTAKVVVDELRGKGEKVGLLKIRVFRPFPHNDIVRVLGKAKAVGVFDRSMSFGAIGGPVYTGIRSSLYHNSNGSPVIYDFLYGLGGRDIKPASIKNVFTDLKEVLTKGKKLEMLNYLDLR